MMDPILVAQICIIGAAFIWAIWLLNKVRKELFSMRKGIEEDLKDNIKPKFSTICPTVVAMFNGGPLTMTSTNDLELEMPIEEKPEAVEEKTTETPPTE